jgi:hypothetical protein
MPRAQRTIAAGEDTHRDSQIERLIEVGQSIAMHLQDLCEEVRKFRDDFSWALNNDRFQSPPLAPLTRMPADPLAGDFGERLNELTPEDVRAEEPPPSPVASPANQSQRHGFLFDGDDES